MAAELQVVFVRMMRSDSKLCSLNRFRIIQWGCVNQKTAEPAQKHKAESCFFLSCVSVHEEVVGSSRNWGEWRETETFHGNWVSTCSVTSLLRDGGKRFFFSFFFSRTFCPHWDICHQVLPVKGADALGILRYSAIYRLLPACSPYRWSSFVCIEYTDSSGRIVLLPPY